jgi:hypothetical protein
MTRRRSKLDLTLPVLMAAGLLVLSCTANRMHRPVSVEDHPDYSLAFIEFDDQGELWAPSQLDRALALLEHENRSPSGVALAMYIHGWNNSASQDEEREGKGSVYAFRQILSRLRADYRQRFPDGDLPVVGIYLSWRGKVSSVPLVRELSFYNRRGAAERVAGPSATEAIYRLLTTARANPRSRSVLIGHSFGSMILERALSQAVVSALLAAPGEELIFPADLVVLFNPAGSAVQTKQLVDMLARNRLKTFRLDENERRVERPLLVSFTSATDRATRSFFPLGMGLKGISKKFRPYGAEYCTPISSQRFLYSHTPGHTPALFSHEITVTEKRYGDPLPETPTDDLPPIFESEYDPITRQVSISFEGTEHRFIIRRKPRALNDTPYWIMQVPRQLIPNHSEIFTEATYALVEAILAYSGALQDDITTRLVREDGVRPVAVVPRADGGALFLDRSRAVYSVDPDSIHPVFVSCMREELDPSDAVGFHVAGHLAYAALVRPQGGIPERCKTDIYEFEVGQEGYRQLTHLRPVGDECFAAAAFDIPGRHIYLSAGGEDGPALWAADLTDAQPRPKRMLDLPGSLPATELFFESTGRRLFAAQRDSGAIWGVDVDDVEPQARLIADQLGWPVALGFGRQVQQLYVTDAKNQRIWTLDCSGPCGEPEVFYQSESLENPTTLSVALDGTIWLGDLKAQTLRTITPDGNVDRTIYSLSGARASPMAPAGDPTVEGTSPP